MNATTIVNQVENIYNGLGQLAFQYQAVTGAVDVSTTPFVEYTYSSPSNGSRLASMVYPNGRTINYDYGSDLSNTNAALDNAIGRLDAIVDPDNGSQQMDIGTGSANSSDAGTVLEQYSYLGLSTIVARNHPQTGINLTLVGTSGSIGTGGDQYAGLDQFGRVVNQNWKSVSSGQSVDNFTYSYDNNSNVTAENNLLDSAYSQTFTYDQLNRLARSTLGGSASQSWTLDTDYVLLRKEPKSRLSAVAAYRETSFTSNGTTQTETANAQNQITSISGSTTPSYDNNGNMTTDQNGNTYTYNAWNQLVSVKNSAGQLIAQYTYNAMGYRITESYPQGGNGVAAGTVNYIYYDSQWQAIETCTNGTANSNVTSQMVWSAAYINAAVLQDTYSAGVIQPSRRIYFLEDANWNTTAIVGLVSGSWQVTRRYVYSPYGNIQILNPNWSVAPAGTQPIVDNLYQGMTLDPVTGLYYARNRNYDPSLGRWINQDPLHYINGANTYQFVESNPVGKVDPWGLDAVYNGMDLGSTNLSPGMADDVLVVGPYQEVTIPWVGWNVGLPGYHLETGFDVVISNGGDLGDILRRIRADLPPNGKIKKLVLDAHGITNFRAKISPLRDLELGNPNGSFTNVPQLKSVIEIGTDGKNGDLDQPTKAFFQEIKGLMSPGGSILLYGCNTATGAPGHNFIQNIANITGVPVTGTVGEVNPWFFHLSGGATLVTVQPIPPG